MERSVAKASDQLYHPSPTPLFLLLLLLPNLSSVTAVAARRQLRLPHRRSGGPTKPNTPSGTGFRSTDGTPRVIAVHI